MIDDQLGVLVAEAEAQVELGERLSALVLMETLIKLQLYVGNVVADVIQIDLLYPTAFYLHLEPSLGCTYPLDPSCRLHRCFLLRLHQCEFFSEKSFVWWKEGVGHGAASWLVQWPVQVRGRHLAAGSLRPAARRPEDPVSSSRM